MKFIESIKLKNRANRYKTKNDMGGIAYVLSVVKEGQTVMDIGAHKAGYLYHFISQVGKSGKIYAFEPQQSLFNYLVKMKQMFGWNNVTIEHLALSDRAGDITLYIPSNKKSGNSSPGATIVSHPERDDIESTEMVDMETLDTYCNKNNIAPQFLKIDVEGNELRIFKGGVETLRKYKPKIIVEIEARHVGNEGVFESFRFLEHLGYQGRFICGNEFLPLSTFSIEKHQHQGVGAVYCNNFIFE